MALMQEVESLIFGFDPSSGKVDNPVLVLLEKVQEYGHDYFEGKNAVGKPFYIMRMCEIFQLGIPGPNQNDAVIRAVKRASEHYNMKPYLVIETNGLGQNVYDHCQQELPNVYGIYTLTDGSSVSRDGRIYKVPGVNMAAELTKLTEYSRLIIPATIKDRKKIIQQFVNFTWKRKESGTLTVENLKSSNHDDICDATGLAAWFGVYGIRKITTFDKSKLGL